MRYGFGIDLGGTTVKLAYFDENGTMLDKWEIPTVTANGGQQILPDIAASVKDYLKKNNIAPESILGLGIGVPGPVDGKGVVNKCINLGWGVFNIAEALSALTGFSVKAGNDANVAALGEYWKGGGVSKAGQFLLDGVEEAFHKYVFHAASGAKFALASLFNDAGAYGAFKLALDAFGK